jgi:arginine decarboxylase
LLQILLAEFCISQDTEIAGGKLERNGRKSSVVLEPTERWSTQDASDLYDVTSWGKGYFSVATNGHLRVHPEKDPARAIDLKELVDTLVLRGISLPILIRFADILKHRMGEIASAFQTAIAEHRYQGNYFCVYPIKVNQQRQVVEEVLEYGRPYHFGLEAGSKPELLAVMALADNETPIICNGFKDDEYIEMAMLAQKLGRHIIPVVEKYTELDLIAKYSELSWPAGAPGAGNHRPAIVLNSV